jgi:hypothetical protein
MNEKDLKCCGNCLRRITLDMGDYVEERCEKRHQTGSYEYCDSWEYDGLHRELRMKGFSIDKI